jgi:hypothetical protein
VLSEENDLLEFRRGISVAVTAACLEKAKQTILIDQPQNEAGGGKRRPSFLLTKPWVLLVEINR